MWTKIVVTVDVERVPGGWQERQNAVVEKGFVCSRGIDVDLHDRQRLCSLFIYNHSGRIKRGWNMLKYGIRLLICEKALGP